MAQDWDTGKVMVFTRDGTERKTELFDLPYYFYVADPEGEFVAMDKKQCSRVYFDTEEEYKLAKMTPGKKYESDIDPKDRILIDNFYGLPAPTIHFAFYDIEVDYDPKRGFSRPDNAYAPINAVTIYQSWTKRYVTLAVPPQNWNGILPSQELKNYLGVHVDYDLTLCENEAELLDKMLHAVADADVISGWHSEFFDMPYSVKRTEMTLGKKATKRWCFPGCRYPKFGTQTKFGTEEAVVTLFGRNHLDYEQLFKKFTYEGRPSFSLAAILADELDIDKLEYGEYAGSLAELYNNRFDVFLLYNIRDVEGIVQLDKKFKFIGIVNQMAHETTVTFESILGTVRYVETGITGFANYRLGKVVQDKIITQDHEKVEGAIVLTPRRGLHKKLGSVDLKSLYPNTIRALNISPEMFVGQFSNGEVDWYGISIGDDQEHTLEMDDGESFAGTGAEWRVILAENKWAVSGYGTVFNQADGPGVLPTILGEWYDERVKLQLEKKRYAGLYEKETDPDKKIEYHELMEYYDLLQLTKKIAMNSMYGALLNAFFRFGRRELGASTTGSGRQITCHMMGTISEFFTGVYSLPVKTTEVGKDKKVRNIYITDPISPVIYGDTDSAYVVMPADTIEEAIEMADLMADYVNASFQEFMSTRFMCQPGFDTLIGASREIVAIRGLFQAKKKYICRVIDQEGKKVDKLKSMGSEIKKSDTPKIIQGFLKEVLNKILDGREYVEVESYIIDQRDTLIKKASNLDIITMGVDMQVNNLTQYYDEWKTVEQATGKRVNLPGHVRAAINFNEAIQHYEGKQAQLIAGGNKVKLFYLNPNEWKFNRIAFPSDIVRFPKWFLENFTVDYSLTEQKMIDLKLSGMFEAINWEVPNRQTRLTNSLLEF
jgi:DNA polymerase elongation subunit (family B)